MGDYYNLQEGDFFVRLPNETVWNLEDNGITLKNELKYPFTVAVLYRLVENTNPINETMFSIGDLITSCGYKKDKDNIKNFKDLLNKLQDKGIIYNVSIPLDKAKYDSFIRCKLNLEVETNFFMIYHKYFKTVMESDYTASVKNNVFTFLCYILARLRTINNDKYLSYCYFSYEKAEHDLNMNEDTIINCGTIAKSLGLILYDNVGHIKRYNKRCSNVYSLTEEGLEFGIVSSYEWYDCEFSTDFIPKKEYKKLYEEKRKERK